VVFAGVRKATWVAGVVLASAPAVRLGIWYFLPEHRPGLGHVFPSVADTLAAGCLLALLRGWLFEQRWYTKLLRSRFFFLVPMLAYAVNLKSSGRLRFAVLETVMTLAIALTIDRSITVHDDAAGRLLNARPLVFVGVLSYSLYLWQQPFLNHYTAAPPTSFPLNILLVAAASWLSYRLVETPFMNWRKRIERAVMRRQRAA
jgi:peptidoglycan/LPS O-acetylase OafA/YrhL